MKKKLLALLLICSMLFGVTSCAFPGMMQNQNTQSNSSSKKDKNSSSKKNDNDDDDDSSKANEDDDYDFDKPLEVGSVKDCKFMSLYSDEDATEVKLSSGKTKTIEIDEALGGKDYMRITLKSDSNLLGTFTYCETDDTDHVITEEFYIEPSDEEIEFRQFLDSYRPNGVGIHITDEYWKDFEAFEKTLLSVSFKNVDEATANIAIYDISVSNRVIPSYNKEIYIEGGNLKVGADLAMGGTLSYLEKTSYGGQTVDEIVDTDGNVAIGVGYAESDICQQQVSENGGVNLINIRDAGREFQQSYYADVGGSMQEATGANGYQRKISYTADPNGYYWPYNPVQGGDEVCNLSQIIDYEVTEKEIYVKVRAMDWANGDAIPGKNSDKYEEVKNGRTTKSYIENWYQIRSGMLEATNRFIDWNGFTDMENIPYHNLEIPAAYVVQPLHNYYCYVGNNPWNLGDETYDWQPELTSWAQGSYVNAHHPEDWFAWVNDEKFGVGVYIPGASRYASGRSFASTEAKRDFNKNALNSPMAEKYLYNKAAPMSPYTSCYVQNTCYTAPVVTVRMKEYVALSYTYVIAVDYLENFRASFKEYHDNGMINNDGLQAWD